MSPKAAAAAVGIGVGAAAGAVAAVVGAPLVLGAVGFTSAGIAAGSFAASMMSAAAVANGGAVAAGSAVAVLQAAGAVGLSGAATAAVTGVGAAVGWLVSLISGKEKGDKSNKKPPNNGADPNLECLPMNPINLSGETAATS